MTIPALCLLATLVTWLWSRSTGLDIREKIERSQERIANTKELLVVMLNAETGVRGYLVSGDLEFLEPNRIAQKTLPIALSNLQRSIENNPKQLVQLDSIRSRIQSIQKLMAELQTTFLAPERSQILKQGKREMDALRQEIDAAQAIEDVSLDLERTNLSDLQSLIQSLQQLFTVAGIMSTVGGIYLFQLLEQELRERTAQIQTHLKAVEKLNLTLLNTNFTLNSRNQELAEFAYATAHDLKTPLRGIATLSEWIEEEVKPYSSEQLDFNIQLLRQRTYRLNALIDGLWEYSNLGQTTIDPEPIELIVFLQEIQSTFPLPAKFTIDVHPTDLQAIACKPHLGKVIEELLENAVKHHDLDPTSDASGKIMISVRLVADKLEFIICDNGPGIAPEHHQRVFRLFETLKARDVQESTGIGLAIAKKLVERVGGKIWLENSALGRGLSVYFTWPQRPIL